MTQDLYPQRMRSIYQMLFEMAAGNFSYRIPRDGADLDLDLLIELVNMVAEEMKASIFHYGYIQPHNTYHYLIQHTFILDEALAIACVNANVPIVLNMAAEDLYGQHFARVLTPDSAGAWSTLTDSLRSDGKFHQTFELEFQSQSGLTIPAFCTVTRLLHSTKTIVSSVTMVPQESVWKEPTSFKTGASRGKRHAHPDAALIQKLYDYVLAHLEEPLPTIKALARKFGSNESKLKSGFRHFFNTSIYQFYTEERLKKAHLLIQQSTIPLKAIALISGFNDYTNFYKAFKKRFHYSPSEINRDNGAGQDENL
jgi:AraC-like DNA-binding protein